jgi:hypothetical protein
VDYSYEHDWVGAATFDLDTVQARRAVLRHSVRLPKNDKVSILEVYCQACRRPWEDVVDEPCSALENNEHLRGGPIGERKKRKHHHNCELLGCDITQDGDGDDDGSLPATG